ncbi:ABC transporter ATP-binding protein [Halopolyspora algeriensis]|nr:ABC transporter ATP-binding protein [Halopolyspora algeriensis]
MTVTSRVGAAECGGTDTPVLEVRDLDVAFPSESGRVHAVRGVSFDLEAGEVLGIVGESGSGKSVSSLALMGLLPEEAQVGGSARLRGQELLGKRDSELSRLRGRKVSMIFQDPLSALTPVYTIGEQLVEAIRTHRDTSGRDAMTRAVELLRMVGVPNAEERVNSFPHEFSGGMRQRVVIAMAIANEPDVIIADEPTTALDVTIQAQVLEVLRRVQRATGAALIMITHDLGVIAGLADRVMVMYAGRPVEVADVDDLYRRPRMPYTLGLLGAVPRADDRERLPLTPVDGNPPSMVDLPPGCPFAPRCPMAVATCRRTEPELLAVDSARHRAACHRSDVLAERDLAPGDIFPRPQTTGAGVGPDRREQRPAVLEVSELAKHFPVLKGTVIKRPVGTVYAVDGVGFDIREGEALALVGESGCGKTTTLMQVLELAAPQQGAISVLGSSTAELGRRDRKRLRQRMQVVFQDPMSSLDPRMPVGEIVGEPLRTHGSDAAATAKRVRELLELVGLRASHADRYPRQFSGGQRQRIGIARALALDPQLLILDEPVSALDVSIQAGVINLLEELRANLNLSYLFVAHDLSVVHHICDRIAVMYLGKLAEIGSVDAVFNTPAHPYTQALLSAVPLPDPARERTRERILLDGDLPSPADPPSGCRFRTRCPKFAVLDADSKQRCIDEEPPMYDRGTDHGAACHYAESLEVL